MASHRCPSAHTTGSLALLGVVLLVLSACGPMQIDYPGMNSGSPQNAFGAFDTDLTHAARGGLNTTVPVYDTFTTNTIDITVTNVSSSTAVANHGPVQVLASGYRFLIVALTLTNTPNGNTKGCPGGDCTEFLSPLQNFRLLDSQNRLWAATTAAEEDCSRNQSAPQPHPICSQRKWLDLLGATGVVGASPPPNGGLKSGQTFTNQLAFVVPTNDTSFTLYFEASRFLPVTAGGAPAGQNTVAAIAITA